MNLESLILEHRLSDEELDMFGNITIGTWVSFLFTVIGLTVAAKLFNIDVEVLIPHLNDLMMVWLCVNVFLLFFTIADSIGEIVFIEKKTITYITKK